MKGLIIYNSYFGNSKKIAETIAKQLGDDTVSMSVNEIKEPNLDGITLLVLGSAIDSWKPAKKITLFLNKLKPDKIKDIPVAVFDTRVKLFIRGDITKKINKVLTNSGGKLIVPPIGFYINSKEGPLLGGEREKAIAWAKLLKSKI